MKLGHLALLLFLISFSTTCSAAQKKKVGAHGHNSSRSQPPQGITTASQMPRSHSVIDFTAHNEPEYITINSAAPSPRNSPRTCDHHAVTIPSQEALQKPKTWWRRNRVNVAVGLSAISPIMLGMTCWFMKGAVNGAVAQVQTEFAPVAQAAGEINALYNFIQNITGAGKP